MPTPVARHHSRDIAWLAHIEDDDRQIVVHAQRDCRCVHHFQLPLQHLLVGDAIETSRRRILHRIGRIDTVNFGGLENYVGLDFQRAQRGGRVSCEVRIAGAGGEDDDAALSQGDAQRAFG